MNKKLVSGKVLEFSVFYLILFINFLSILALSVFNYVVFHNNSKKTYLESFMNYNQKVTDLAFNNIDQKIMEAVYNIPKLHFSQIRKNEILLKPQEEKITGQTTEIRELVNELYSIQINYPFITSMDIYYENTDTIVTGFSNVHFPKDEEMAAKYLPWFQEFEKQGKACISWRSPSMPIRSMILSFLIFAEYHSPGGMEKIL